MISLKNNVLGTVTILLRPGMASYVVVPELFGSVRLTAIFGNKGKSF